MTNKNTGNCTHHTQHAKSCMACKLRLTEQQRDELLAAANIARRALAHADSKAPGLYGYEYACLDKAISKAGAE